MTLLHDAMTAYLAGLTTKLNEKEIWWQNESGFKVTVELVDTDSEQYIVRRYYDNGNLWWQDNYCKDKRHGSCIDYLENGDLLSVYVYENGKTISRKTYKCII